MKCPPLEYPRAVRRLRVGWRDGQWTILKDVTIPQMTLPKASELPEGQAVSGFWWEATNAEGRALYRRVEPDPTESRVEVVRQDGSFRNLEGHRHEAVFDVLIPDLPEIEELRIFSSREEGAEAAAKGMGRRAPARLTATLKIRGPQKEEKEEEEGGGHGHR
jgi:hypothetical protein